MTNTARKKTLAALATSFLAASLLSACGPDNRPSGYIKDDQTDPLEQYTEKQKETLAKLEIMSALNRNLIEGKQTTVDLLYFNQKVKPTAGEGAAKTPVSMFSYACLSHNPDVAADMATHRNEEKPACRSPFTGENSQTLGKDLADKLRRFVATYDGKTPVAPLFHKRSTPIVIEPDTVTAYLPELDMKCALLHYTDTYKIDPSGNYYNSQAPNVAQQYAYTPFIYAALRDCEPVTETSNPLAAKRLKHLKAQIG